MLNFVNLLNKMKVFRLILIIFFTALMSSCLKVDEGIYIPQIFIKNNNYLKLNYR